MRYEPVKILTLFHRIFTRDRKFVRQTNYHYTCFSNLVGSCGHKHRTKETAKPCQKRMRRLWTETRNQRRALTTR